MDTGDGVPTGSDAVNTGGAAPSLVSVIGGNVIALPLGVTWNTCVTGFAAARYVLGALLIADCEAVIEHAPVARNLITPLVTVHTPVEFEAKVTALVGVLAVVEVTVALSTGGGAEYSVSAGLANTIVTGSAKTLNDIVAVPAA